MSKSVQEKINTFCTIQLEILKDKETSLRKELLECKIQREFLEGMVQVIAQEKDDNPKN